tara:strand:+ start:776 stop:1624 length:849 start_codon:yes stop_codon:yes gene_type:complete
LSAVKKKGLGKGLSALFGDIEKNLKSPQTSSNKLQIADIERNKYQPRNFFDEEKLSELSKSIKENGIIQPIAVRPNKYKPGKYELIAGERRWLAAQRAGMNEVPAIILNVDDQKSLEIAIVENIQRQDLNIIEEARGYEKLVKEFGYNHEKISKFMSKSRSHISNTLRLLSLPNDVIGLLEEGIISAGQARPLIGMANASEVAENITKRNLSSREVEALTRKKDKNKSIKIDDPNISFLKNELESRLGLSVEIINKKNNSGKVIIKYKSLDQFDIITKLLKD